MAGMGAGNTMVIAPLMFAAVGFIPEVVAAMAIATAIGFTTSPASTETGLAATAAGLDVQAFANMMLPVTIIVFLLAAGLAFYGVHKRKNVVRTNAQEENEFDAKSNKELWSMVVPTIAFLVLVVFGGKINALFPIPIFVPMLNVIIAAILCVIFCKEDSQKVSENLIDGSRFILTTLFGVGIFLGFINMIGFLGTFAELAGLIANGSYYS
jgi:C4-dicarboxylate transporter